MIWKHMISARHIVPLEPDARVFGGGKDDYFIITSYSHGSHWKMPVANACAKPNGRLQPILTSDVKSLLDDPNKGKLARDIWPDQYVAVEMQSPCCSATIDASLADGVLVGWCSECNTPVVRQNPRTGIQEWLDGNSPYTQESLQAVPVAT